MVQLTRLNHVPFFLNSDLIEHIESTPDTVVTLTNGQKYLVVETPDTVVNRVVESQRRIYAAALSDVHRLSEAARTDPPGAE